MPLSRFAKLNLIILVCTIWVSACSPATPTLTPTWTSTPVPAATFTPTTLPTSTPAPASTHTPSPTATVTATASPTTPPTPTPLPWNGTIEIDAADLGKTFSPLMLGSNLPAWLKVTTFENAQFRRRVAASGVTLLRIPGGSWADEYGWLSCEKGRDMPGAFPCRYPWASRPTDFINFFRGVAELGIHIEPMYIINVNYTAQEAAAVVAFYNAAITDTTSIGLDRNGTDWLTAGDWAQLRAAGGNEQPLGIKFWEIGNEVHGGKPTTPGCPSNGWEETWTCNGREYILGTDQHDGLVQMRAAMLTVDPTIWVGAVGGSDNLLGNRWSEAVLKAGSQHIDYIVIHTYPSYHIYGNLRKEFDEILALPQTHWPRLKQSADNALDRYGDGVKIPIVINEYELTPPWGQQDIRNYMNKYADAIFIADSIGQMIAHGVDIAAQWDIMNGKSDDFGNEFGLMKADGSNDRQPKYWAFPLWSRFGTTLLPAQSSAKPTTELSIYAGRLDNGHITLLVINKMERPANVQITLSGIAQIVGGLADVVIAPSLDSLDATFNGQANPADDLSDAPPLPIPSVSSNRLDYTFEPLAITLLRLDVQR